MFIIPHTKISLKRKKNKLLMKDNIYNTSIEASIIMNEQDRNSIRIVSLQKSKEISLLEKARNLFDVSFAREFSAFSRIAIYMKGCSSRQLSK